MKRKTMTIEERQAAEQKAHRIAMNLRACFYGAIALCFAFALIARMFDLSPIVVPIARFFGMDI